MQLPCLPAYTSRSPDACQADERVFLAVSLTGCHGRERARAVKCRFA